LSGTPGIAPNKRITVHGIDFAVVDEGEGPAVLLLHGFPDSSYLWRNQIPALVDGGFRVIAPDLRGFGESGKPVGAQEYTLTKLLSDVAGILSALGVARPHVVGHDWGASLAWVMAALMPRRVDHLVAMSVGHPRTFHHPSIEQREKSWYILFFQFEGVAEELLSRHNFRAFKEFQQGQGDVDRYVRDLARPGALTAALNWYRANRAPAAELEPPPRLPLIAAPTLGVWSSGDRALLEETMLASSEFVSGPWQYARVEGASHWIPLDAPDEVNKLLLSFLGSEDTRVVARVRRRY
jgi:pimeloyl-ACP methyl ester carboxylesterase